MIGLDGLTAEKSLRREQHETVCNLISDCMQAQRPTAAVLALRAWSLRGARIRSFFRIAATGAAKGGGSCRQS